VNLIRIEGGSELLRSLHGIPDLYLALGSLRMLGDDRAEIWARADTGAIQQVEALGCVVDVEMDDTALQAHDDAVEHEIQQNRGTV
jgi:hypothetical protein